MDFHVCRMEFRSSDGKNNIISKIYMPAQTPKGVIQIVHGMCEHMGRYESFMKFFAENGYVVCGNDHLGHGETVANKEDLGFFGTAQGYSKLLQDVHKLNLIMKKDYPDLPYFILGHSMGSFITRLYLAKYDDNLTGAIISGTGGPNPMVKAGYKLACGAIRKRGERYRPKNIDKMVFGAYNTHFKGKNSTSKDWLSSDPQVVADFMADEYCMFTFTAAGFKDLFALHYLANREDTVQRIPHQLPILLLSGEQDPVGAYGKGVHKVYSMFKKAGIENVTLQLYPNGRHEMLNEVN
ncbi:MAG: alpha/beta fold hydrolase, partial [Oscillospiraceae bacterium]